MFYQYVIIYCKVITYQRKGGWNIQSYGFSHRGSEMNMEVKPGESQRWRLAKVWQK